MIKGGVFLALLIFSLISVMADPIIYSNCSIFGNCQPQATKGGGNQNITIFQNITNVNQTLNITNNITNIFQASNFSILVDWANLTNIPIYVKDWNLSGLIKDWSWVLNGTGLIKDWNNTGLIQDWNQSGFIKNWNFTGLILNWTNQPDNNLSGLIQDWNRSSLIINWSNVITSSGLTGAGSSGYLALWNSTSSLNNSVMYQSSGKIGINTINPSYLLDIEGTSSGGGILINGTNPAIALGNASQTLGYATTAGAFAGNAQIGDVILRSQDGHNLIINTGTGNAEFTVNGTNGFIGIGTINPTSALDLESGDFYINRNNGIYFNVAGVGTRAKILSDSSNNLMFGNSVFYPILNLTLDGNVIVQNDLGIGTNNPQNNLNVIGVTNTTSSLYALSSTFSVFAAGNVTRMAIVAQNNTAYSMITMNPDYSQATKQWNIGVNSTGSNGQIFFADAGGIGGTRMVIGSGSNNGFVGIGTTNPQNALNVIGDINATTSIYSNGKNITELIKYLDNGTFYLASNPNSYVSNTSGLVLNWTNQPDNNKSGLIKDWNQSGYITNSNNTGLILNWTNQADHNESGLIKDWNQSGILINWNNSMNASGLLVNYSNLNPNNYVSNSSGLIREWNNSINSTGLIRNYSSLLNGTGLIKDWNSTGFIKDWNQTGFIKDWSYLSGGSGITNGSSAWLQNLSLSGDFLVDTTTFALFVNTTSHHVGINTINPQSELNVVGDTNLTGNLNVTNNLLIDPLVSTLFVDSTNHRIGIKTTNTNLYPLNIGATSGRGINITTSGLLSSGVISLLIQMAGTNQATALEINNSAGAGSWGINSYVSKPTSLSGRFIGDFVIYNGTFDNNGNYYLYTASYNTTGNRNLTNGNITSVTLGMAVGVQTYGAKPLPPYGNSTCISAQYPMWAGNITRNSSGIYACGGSITPDNWTRIAI